MIFVLRRPDDAKKNLFDTFHFLRRIYIQQRSLDQWVYIKAVCGVYKSPFIPLIPYKGSHNEFSKRKQKAAHKWGLTHDSNKRKSKDKRSLDNNSNTNTNQKK